MNQTDAHLPANDNNPDRQILPADLIFDEFPAEVRGLLESVWSRLPDDRREQMLGLLPMLPLNQADGLRRLFELGREHVDMAFGDYHDVAIVGPTNVGKSTLYNQLIRAKKDAAAVSPVPGTTRINQEADAGMFSIVDTPGMDAVGQLGQSERQQAMSAAHEADFLIIVFDAVQGVKQSEKSLFQELRHLGKPYVVVLNKMDLLKRRERLPVIERAAINLGIPISTVIPISAEKGDKIERLLMAIVKSQPGLLAALGQALPAYRSRLAWQAILRAASSSAVVALTPIPLVDFLPLAAVQGLLVLSIARIYKYKITPKRARELAGSLGAGYLGRMAFYELTKLGGPPAWIVSIAVAASTTVVVGYGAVLWFSKGEKLTGETRKQLMQLVSQTVIDRLRRRGRKPNRQQLATELDEILADANVQIEQISPEEYLRRRNGSS